MKVPIGSLNGPNVSGLIKPRFCSSHGAATSMFGTVIPMWSMPSKPGTLVTTESIPFSFGDQSGFTLGTSYAMPSG